MVSTGYVVDLNYKNKETDDDDDDDGGVLLKDTMDCIHQCLLLLNTHIHTHSKRKHYLLFVQITVNHTQYDRHTEALSLSLCILIVVWLARSLYPSTTTKSSHNW